MFETWQGWKDDASQRLFDDENIAFPHEQYDPEPVFRTTLGVITGEIKTYRNVEPKEIIDQQREQLDAAWTRQVDEQLGTRFELVQKAYDIQPETPVDDRAVLFFSSTLFAHDLLQAITSVRFYPFSPETNRALKGITPAHF